MYPKCFSKIYNLPIDTNFFLNLFSSFQWPETNSNCSKNIIEIFTSYFFLFVNNLRNFGRICSFQIILRIILELKFQWLIFSVLSRKMFQRHLYPSRTPINFLQQSCIMVHIRHYLQESCKNLRFQTNLSDSGRSDIS